MSSKVTIYHHYYGTEGERIVRLHLRTQTYQEMLDALVQELQKPEYINNVSRIDIDVEHWPAAEDKEEEPAA